MSDLKTSWRCANCVETQARNADLEFVLGDITHERDWLLGHNAHLVATLEELKIYIENYRDDIGDWNTGDVLKKISEAIRQSTEKP